MACYNTIMAHKRAKILREQTWNLNWVTHALVNKVTREEYAARFPSPYPQDQAATDTFEGMPEGQYRD